MYGIMCQALAPHIGTDGPGDATGYRPNERATESERPPMTTETIAQIDGVPVHATYSEQGILLVATILWNGITVRSDAVESINIAFEQPGLAGDIPAAQWPILRAMVLANVVEKLSALAWAHRRRGVRVINPNIVGPRA